MFHVEQICANEIIIALLQENLHPRALAQRLGTNHMTISRHLHDLSRGNVVDFRAEGKNKIFFLKETLEARNAIMIAEIYRMNRAVVRYPLIRAIASSVLQQPDIRLAVLFGSYAKGLATKDSDIDLFVETGSSEIKKHLEKRHPSLQVKIGTFDPGDLLVQEIIKNHIILRGVELFIEKTRIPANTVPRGETRPG